MQPLNSIVKVRLDEKTLFMVKQAADKAGLHLATWVRHTIKNAADEELGKVAARKLNLQRIMDAGRRAALDQARAERELGQAEAEKAMQGGLQWDWQPEYAPPDPTEPRIGGGSTH